MASWFSQLACAPGRSRVIGWVFKRLRSEPGALSASHSFLARLSSSQSSSGLIFPYTTRLKDNTEMTVRPMTDAQISTFYNIVVEEARRSQTYGLGEYESEHVFRTYFAHGHKFTVAEAATDQVVSYFIIADSPLTRGARIGDVVIYIEPSYRSKGVSGLTLDIAEKLLKSLGYIGIYIDVLTNNEHGIRSVRDRKGYNLVATIPISAELSDGSLVGAHVFFNDLRDAD